MGHGSTSFSFVLDEQHLRPAGLAGVAQAAEAVLPGSCEGSAPFHEEINQMTPVFVVLKYSGIALAPKQPTPFQLLYSTVRLASVHRTSRRNQADGVWNY